MELEWLREWRERILSAMRIWVRADGGYEQSCKNWTQVLNVLKEKPPES